MKTSLRKRDIENLREYGVHTVVPLISVPKGDKMLTTKYVFKEIQGLSYAAREAVYISNFMRELHFEIFGSVPIHSDSTGALSVAGNAMHFQRTKHVARRYFFIRELVQDRANCPFTTGGPRCSWPTS